MRADSIVIEDDPALRAHDYTTIAARHDAAGFRTRYYSPAIHISGFALPPEIEAIQKTMSRLGW